MIRGRGAALAETPADTFGPAVKLGEAARAFRMVMRRWPAYKWVPVFFECPHCGALCASKAGKVRHRMREARIEIALRELGLLEPGLDIRIHDDTSL